MQGGLPLLVSGDGVGLLRQGYSLRVANGGHGLAAQPWNQLWVVFQCFDGVFTQSVVVMFALSGTVMPHLEGAVIAQAVHHPRDLRIKQTVGDAELQQRVLHKVIRAAAPLATRGIPHHIVGAKDGTQTVDFGHGMLLLGEAHKGVFVVEPNLHVVQDFFPRQVGLQVPNERVADKQDFGLATTLATLHTDLWLVLRRVVGDGEDEVECLFVVFAPHRIQLPHSVYFDIRNTEVIEAVHVAEEAVVTVSCGIAPMRVALGNELELGGVFYLLVPARHFHMREVDGGHQRVIIICCAEITLWSWLVVRQVFGVKLCLVGCHKAQKFNAVVLQHITQFVHHPDVLPGPLLGAVVGAIHLDRFYAVIVVEGLGVE